MALFRPVSPNLFCLFKSNRHPFWVCFGTIMGDLIPKGIPQNGPQNGAKESRLDLEIGAEAFGSKGFQSVPRRQPSGCAGFGACCFGRSEGSVLGTGTAHDLSHGVAPVVPKSHPDDRHAQAACDNGQVWCANAKEDSAIHKQLSCIAQLSRCPDSAFVFAIWCCLGWSIQPKSELRSCLLGRDIRV